jgi:hypothetical protein
VIRRTASVLVMAVVTTACSRSSPTTPTPPPGPMSGVWLGTATAPGTSMSLRLELQDSPFGGAYNISGRFESLAGTTTTVGSAVGVLFQGSASLNLTPTPAPPCNVAQPFPAGQLLLQLTLDGTRLSGEGALTRCGGSDRAQAAFTKQ